MPPPPMMAIGDSLFNGVRSLTISQPLAKWSAPAQVARAFGIAFALPDYPRQIIVDFERWLGEFPNVFGIVGDVESNIAFWDARPGSSLPRFDNIAIASSSFSDLWLRTADCAQHDIDQLRGQLGDQFSKLGDHLSRLYFDFNTRFVLNPAADPATGGLSPLDIVALRKPERLLVCIGANNGLFEMGFAAVASSGAPGGADGPYNQADMVDLATLFDKLRSLPAGVGHIYVNALPLPSMVADMMPLPDVSDTDKPGPGRYYPRYENWFGFDYNALTDQQVALNDAMVRKVNEKIRELASSDPRIHVVPIDQVITDYDFKTNALAKTVNIDGKVLSNVMLQGPEILFPSFWRGGLIGLDGMHPTFVGYALMADAIVQAIEAAEGIRAVNPINVSLAYQADTLLQKVPLSWDIVLGLSLEIRRALAAGGALAPTSQKHQAVGGLMSALSFKYD